MNRVEVISHRLKALPCLRGVSIAVVESERHEEYALGRAENVSNFLFSMIQVTTAMKG
jgi:hypothetical protein